MRLMTQATVAVACMTLSAAALAQVRGVYVIPDKAAKGSYNVNTVMLACESFDPKATKETAVNCTYIPQPNPVKQAVRGRPAVLLFWNIGPEAWCVWDGRRWIPPGCR
jgi:hypothetical protein